MTGLIDLTLPYGPDLPTWPGDPPVALWRVARADPTRPGTVNLSRLETGTHAGTHLDPPRHLRDDGADVASLDLGALCGPCRVLDLRGGPPVVTAARLAAAGPPGERLLLRTAPDGWWRGPGALDPGRGLDPSAAAWLREQGVRLVGIDALSIEPEAPDLPVHRQLLGQDPPVLVLEGLDLSGAPAGDYTLWCLPLPLVEGDGAPARAVLVPAVVP